VAVVVVVLFVVSISVSAPDCDAIEADDGCDVDEFEVDGKLRRLVIIITMSL
jgi:hypothetical protein